MSLERRGLLQILSFGLGSSLVLTGSKLKTLAETTAQSSASNPTGVQADKQRSREKEMEKVAGIGGLFFRAHDPAALARWYEQHLGIAPVPTSYGGPSWQQEAGTTVFSPFPETSKYFGDPQKVWMVNFRVHDLEKMVAQLESAGIEVKVDPQSYPNGRFARLHDPEGNPIELWQPVRSGA